MADQTKSSIGGADCRRRRDNAFRMFLNPMFCCMASPTIRTEEKQSNSTTSRTGEIRTVNLKEEVCTSSDHDVAQPKKDCEVEKDRLQNGDESEVSMDDVTILEWSRFSKVYRRGLPVMLGEGDEGYVMLMKDSETNQLVAVKTWHNGSEVDIGMMNDNFKFEVSTLKKFDGVKYFPHLIGILPNAESGVGFSLVQEFIGDSTKKKSVSLLDVIRERELTREGVITAAAEVTDALAEMHRNGWLHCDVKIDNVMLQREDQCRFNVADRTICKNGGWWINEPAMSSCDNVKNFHAKLIDFGGARPISLAKLPKKLPKKMKKVMYQMCPHIAPEIVEGRGRVPYSYESDVYSLGRLLKDLSDESGIRDLDKLAKRCLAKKAKRRPSIDSVAEELKNMLSSLQKQSS